MLQIEYLNQRQSLSLNSKIMLTQVRIKQWYDHYEGDVYVSFSGGKDSTVLLDIVRHTPGVYDVPAVFCDTGLEYPEVRAFALSHADVVLKPKKTFRQVIDEYGYPVISKEQSLYIRQYRTTKSEYLRNMRLNGSKKSGRFCISKKWRFLVDAPFKISERCCDVMKKRPFEQYKKETGRFPIIATMADESNLRRRQYQKYGCNAFDVKSPRSTPMGFWTEQDVLRYIKEHRLEYASVYGEIVSDDLLGEHLVTTGCNRTGCMFCCFGVHLEGQPNRFQLMKHTHPKQYEYCMDKLGLSEVLDYIKVPH